jgi:hypothetical protein
MLATMPTWHPRRAAALFALACSAMCASPVIATAAPKSRSSRQSREAAATLADVDSAEKYYVNMDYENANAIAGRVIAQHGLSHDQLVRASWP